MLKNLSDSATNSAIINLNLVAGPRTRDMHTAASTIISPWRSERVTKCVILYKKIKRITGFRMNLPQKNGQTANFASRTSHNTLKTHYGSHAPEKEVARVRQHYQKYKHFNTILFKLLWCRA